jgi:hypothetical protein
VISLGDQYLASYFDTDRFPPLRRKIPLELVRCNTSKSETACGLVQLKHTVSSDFMYSSYGYRSGINESMVDHLQTLAREVEQKMDGAEGGLIVDIGANDGTLIRGYQSKKSMKIGFEPSNVAPTDAELPADVSYVRTYFSIESFRKRFAGAKAKIITSIAMFYDLEDPNRFVSDIAEVLDDEGCWVLELSYLPLMLKQNSFDTICHEHLEYYHFSPIEKLLTSHGLKVFDVQTNGMNGGSFRLYVCHAQSALAQRDTQAYYRVMQFKQAEFEMALEGDVLFDQFRAGSQKIKAELPKLLADLAASGKKVWGYGASTKGNVILQYCGITPNLLPAIADRNPAKHGTKTLGTEIPIRTEDEMRKAKPDFLLALPWHFISNFLEREREFCDRGGKFIVPMPEVRIVGRT